MRVEVVFEPERTGEVGDTLIVSSPGHGSYRCKLRGLCSPPLPQVRAAVVVGEAAVAVAVVVVVAAAYATVLRDVFVAAAHVHTRCVGTRSLDFWVSFGKSHSDTQQLKSD